MNSKTEEIRDLTSAEVGETSGGIVAQITAASIHLRRLLGDWKLIGCGVENGRTYCDFEITGGDLWR